MVQDNKQTEISRTTQLLVRLIKVLKALLRLFPSCFVVRFGFIGGYIASFFFKREMTIASVQLAVAFPSINKQECTKLAQKVFAHIGEFSCETFIFDKLLMHEEDGKDPTTYKYITVTPDDFFPKTIKEGKGVVALSGHIGCFELLPAYYINRGIPVSTVGRLPNFQTLALPIKELRDSYNAELLWRDDIGSTRKLLKTIKQAKCVAALIDQDTDLDNEFCPFFGIPAAHPVTLIKLAIKRNLLIISTFIVRVAHLKYEVFTDKIDYNPNSESACQDILKAYNKRLEELITKYPEQWLWWHRRWRRRPDIDYQKHPDKLFSTSNYLAWLKNIQRSN